MLIDERSGIYQLQIRLPFKLDHINCYAVKGDEGWSIIDTGLNTEGTKQVWLEFMSKHQISPGKIKGIYLTHNHPDHYGLAGWLQELSGAPVFMGKEDVKGVKIYDNDGIATGEMIGSLFLRHGMPEKLVILVVETMRDLVRYVFPQPSLTVLEPGTVVRLGNIEYEAVWTPGHSDGHLCFQGYNKVLFSGDHLLANITSNISYWPDALSDPLEAFLSSLKEVGRRGSDVILPAHGEMFNNLQERIITLEEHHQRRLSQMLECAADGASAYEICCEVFGEGLNFHELRFAMSETLAHLIHLVNQGLLHVYKRENSFFFG